jgi:hypothetical protein
MVGAQTHAVNQDYDEFDDHEHKSKASEPVAILGDSTGAIHNSESLGGVHRS